jgi:hypothetical protein
MRALCILIGYHTSLLSAITVMAILFWLRIGTKLTKHISIAIQHFKLISVPIIHCYTWILWWGRVELKLFICRDGKGRIDLEAATLVLLLWAVRLKCYRNKMDVRLVVLMVTLLYYVDLMSLLPVGLVVKSVDDNVGPMAMSMSGDGGVPDCCHVTGNNEIDDDDDDVQVQLSASSTKDSTSEGGSNDGGDNFFIEDDDDNNLFGDSDDEGENSNKEEREEESNDGVEGGEDDEEDDDNNDDDSALEDDSEENDEDDDIFAEIQKDRDINVFLIFEELFKKRFGEEPPKAQMNLCKFLHPDRYFFVQCYHIVAVHPAAQIYLVRDLAFSVQ